MLPYLPYPYICREVVLVEAFSQNASANMFILQVEKHKMMTSTAQASVGQPPGWGGGGPEVNHEF